ncbi:MAG TPA: tetratricopeptide repeat protein, partial [Acidisarcina sp.]
MRKTRTIQSGAAIYLMLLPWLALAENGKLVIHIADPQARPVQGIWLSTAGDGGGEAESDATGRVRLSLAAQTKANTWVTIQIVRSPKKKDFVLASPWNSKALVPSFENESDNYVDVVVIERGDKAALESGKVISSIAARVNDANSAQIFSSRHDATTPKQNLARIAQQYGLSPPDVDNAIRAWGKKATDPFDIGLAQFYARNYSDASDNLALSVLAREGDLKIETEKTFNANFFLGQALYAQGAYQRAAKTFKRASELRLDDARTINLEALSLEQAGQFSEAEPLFRQALLLNERTKGASDRITLISRSNLASILLDERDLASARPLYEQVLPVELNAMPNDPATASTMTGLASLLKYEHDYVGATKLDQRALAIL